MSNCSSLPLRFERPALITLLNKISLPWIRSNGLPCKLLIRSEIDSSLYLLLLSEFMVIRDITNKNEKHTHLSMQLLRAGPIDHFFLLFSTPTCFRLSRSLCLAHLMMVRYHDSFTIFFGFLRRTIAFFSVGNIGKEANIYMQVNGRVYCHDTAKKGWALVSTFVCCLESFHGFEIIQCDLIRPFFAATAGHGKLRNLRVHGRHFLHQQRHRQPHRCCLKIPLVHLLCFFGDS